MERCENIRRRPRQGFPLRVVGRDQVAAYAGRHNQINMTARSRQVQLALARANQLLIELRISLDLRLMAEPFGARPSHTLDPKKTDNFLFIIVLKRRPVLSLLHFFAPLPTSMGIRYLKSFWPKRIWRVCILGGEGVFSLQSIDRDISLVGFCLADFVATCQQRRPVRESRLPSDLPIRLNGHYRHLHHSQTRLELRSKPLTLTPFSVFDLCHTTSNSHSHKSFQAPQTFRWLCLWKSPNPPSHSCHGNSERRYSIWLAPRLEIILAKQFEVLGPL